MRSQSETKCTLEHFTEVYYGCVVVLCHYYFVFQDLIYTQPLIIHTQILPPGVSPNDPRLLHARVVSERTYLTNCAVFPEPSFIATIHASLIPPDEPERRWVSR